MEYAVRISRSTAVHAPVVAQHAHARGAFRLVSTVARKGGGKDVLTMLEPWASAPRAKRAKRPDGGPREARLDSSVKRTALGIAFAIAVVCCSSIHSVVFVPFAEPLLHTPLAATTGWP